jgi:Phosphotransferase system, mannose/fructose-specific component IIA
MTLKIILASHGELAKGMKQSVELIAGKQENLEAFCAYTENDYNLQLQVSSLMDREAGELIVITDIFGGSVNNEFMRYLRRGNLSLIAGMNMAIVIELLTKINSGGSIEELIKEAIKTSKESITNCNDLIGMGSSIIEDEF